MNGAEAGLRAAVASGIDTCFANPGTTEMEFVAALDEIGEIRSVLGLFEGVVTGAADGYARATGRPALTLTHLGPGFANGVANLHNARRAHSPVVNLIGDHASWHLAADAPLTSDIDALAGTVSLEVLRASSPDHLVEAIADAASTAVGPPSGVVSVVAPQDAAWGDASSSPPPRRPPTSVEPDHDAVERAIEALRGRRAGLLLGGVLRRAELDAAARLQSSVGCAVFVDTFTAVLERGRGLPSFPRLPYFPEQAIEALAVLEVVVLAGTVAPVAFFGYRHLGRSSLVTDDAGVVALSPPGVRAAEALEAVAEGLGDRGSDRQANGGQGTPAAGQITAPDDGPLTVETLGLVVAEAQPDGAIVVDEAATSGAGWAAAAGAARPHESYSLTGGAIGQGLPCAVGAAVGAPDRPVIALQADGSGLYTAQALWTMARESLDVTVVVCANRAYRILQVELARTGHADVGATGRGLTELRPPAVDWVSLAHGFGVDGVQVDTVGGLRRSIERALGSDGPFLIEALL